MAIENVSFEKINNVNKYKGAGDGIGSNTESRKPVDEKTVQKELNHNEIAQLADDLNKSIHELNERITFSFHEETGRIIVKVMNKDTNEVVRQIPPQDAINLLEHIQDYIGMLVDESR